MRRKSRSISIIPKIGVNREKIGLVAVKLRRIRTPSPTIALEYPAPNMKYTISENTWSVPSMDATM